MKCRISKFVVTHIDADHIFGAFAFIKENGPSDSPSIIAIDEIWFNSYRHLSFKDKENGIYDGEKRYITEVVVSELLMLGTK